MVDKLNKDTRRGIFLGAYRIEWSDQKIMLDCVCGEKDLEIFSDHFCYCPKCSRRFSIQEIIKMEESIEGEE